MTFLYLFYEFAKIGLFTFGGGMATLPLLTDLGIKTGWYGAEFVTEMVAIANSTPGPIGLNMATYVGYQVGSGAVAGTTTVAGGAAAVAGTAAVGAGSMPLGILGAVVASLGIAAPCIIISLIVGACIKKYSDSEVIKNMFSGIRPVVLGLILYAAWTVAQTALFDGGASLSAGGTINYTKLIFFAIIFVVVFVWKKHPGILLLVSAVAGIVLGL